MNIKKPLSIVLVFILLVPWGCWWEENCTDKIFFKITGIEVEVIDAQPDTWDALLLYVRFKETFIAQHKRSGGNVLYADCDGPGARGTKVGVERLDIVALNDYNETFQINDTINSITQLNELERYQHYLDGPFISIDTYLEQNVDRIKSVGFTFKLTEEPAEPGEYRFKIIYKLKNGEIFSEETESINFSR